uniref:Seminal fluid protein 26Ad n=1 Tax=Drosophila melanogaster TaxID=7227 RepID=C4NAP0_DROME|nr:seminal fluid protein 26Ad [Drosophila melanogaster]
MASLKWLAILQLLIIFGALGHAEVDEITDVVKEKLYEAISKTGSTIKSGSASLQSLDDAVRNVIKMKKGAAKSLLDLVSNRILKPEKDAPASLSCGEGELVCEIKGVLAAESTQQPNTIT